MSERLSFSGCRSREEATARFEHWIDRIAADSWRQLTTDLLLQQADVDAIESAVECSQQRYEVSRAALLKHFTRVLEVNAEVAAATRACDARFAAGQSALIASLRAHGVTDAELPTVLAAAHIAYWHSSRAVLQRLEDLLLKTHGVA
jgi:hypothetical protein